ncbi:hypothetical protein N7539_008471, partial [Penicillium diatomitis]
YGGSKRDQQIDLNLLLNIPLLAFAATFCQIGSCGHILLWRQSSNLIWVQARIFLSHQFRHRFHQYIRKCLHKSRPIVVNTSNSHSVSDWWFHAIIWNLFHNLSI